jgi:hypothetical protein
MRGGRLLGQGVYGCTFEPAPRCAGGRVFREIGGRPAVGKVTTENTADELAAGQRIMRLPMAAAYFALPSASCRPEMPIADPDISACKVIREASEAERRSATMLVLPAAGQQLVQWGAADPARAAKTLDDQADAILDEVGRLGVSEQQPAIIVAHSQRCAH